MNKTEIIEGILQGKNLVDLLAEKQGDWDIDSEEAYADADQEARENYEKELQQWQQQAIETLTDYYKATESILELFDNVYGVDLNGTTQWPFKAVKGQIKDVKKGVRLWLTQLSLIIREAHL